MKAIRIHQFGGSDVMKFDSIDRPVPKTGEVLVRIRAAGVNPVDAKIRAGQFPKFGPDQLPLIPGRDICGSIIEGSTGQTGLHAGQTVFALLDWSLGGYAEFVALPASLCVAKPERLDVLASAGVPLAAMTAWQGLFDHGGLSKGQSVLIHAGAGGVGHFAIQFAKMRGARVFTTASADNREFVSGLGADVAVDHQRQRFEDVVRDVDMVFDLMGGETRDRSWSVLKPGGILVTTVGQPEERQAAELGVRAAGYMAHTDAAQLVQIRELIDAGRVMPTVTRSFALEAAAEAHDFLEQRHPRGKIVLGVGL